MKTLTFYIRNKQPKGYDKEHNYLGFRVIEILEFNYDSEGSALCLFDERIDQLNKKDLEFVLYSGWYRLDRRDKKIDYILNNR